MAVRVLIAEDHAVVRQGLQVFLRLDDGIEVVGEAADGQAAVELAHQVRPDVVLMDLVMPVMDGISATAAIRRDLPDVQVIALTSFLEDHLVAEALRAGAIGYLLQRHRRGQPAPGGAGRARRPGVPVTRRGRPSGPRGAGAERSD